MPIRPNLGLSIFKRVKVKASEKVDVVFATDIGYRCNSGNSNRVLALGYYMLLFTSYMLWIRTLISFILHKSFLLEMYIKLINH